MLFGWKITGKIYCVPWLYTQLVCNYTLQCVWLKSWRLIAALILLPLAPLSQGVIYFPSIWREPIHEQAILIPRFFYVWQQCTIIMYQIKSNPRILEMEFVIIIECQRWCKDCLWMITKDNPRTAKDDVKIAYGWSLKTTQGPNMCESVIGFIIILVMQWFCSLCKVAFAALSSLRWYHTLLYWEGLCHNPLHIVTWPHHIYKDYVANSHLQFHSLLHESFL